MVHSVGTSWFADLGIPRVSEAGMQKNGRLKGAGAKQAEPSLVGGAQTFVAQPFLPQLGHSPPLIPKPWQVSQVGIFP